jgi:hypothetical protein
MRWPWRCKGEPSISEGKEIAKRDEVLSLQREIADVLVESSAVLAHEHGALLRQNNFGPKAARALREAHR